MNTKLEILLWQQSLAKWLESECYCLSKTTIRAVLWEVLLHTKSLCLPSAIKSLWTVSYSICNNVSTTERFSVNNNPFEVALLWTTPRDGLFCCIQQHTVSSQGILVNFLGVWGCACTCVCVRERSTETELQKKIYFFLIYLTFIYCILLQPPAAYRVSKCKHALTSK